MPDDRPRGKTVSEVLADAAALEQHFAESRASDRPVDRPEDLCNCAAAMRGKGSARGPMHGMSCPRYEHVDPAAPSSREEAAIVLLEKLRDDPNVVLGAKYRREVERLTARPEETRG